MRTIDLKTDTPFIRYEALDIGDFFFFENFLIIELKEGVTVTLQSFSEAETLMKQVFGNNKFGFIANRINSYAIKVEDMKIFNERFKNLAAYATVTYTELSVKVFEIENCFFNFNRKKFNSLTNAIEWVNNTVCDKSEII